MSRNEWERGELKMSVKEFGSVRRDMVAFCNERQAQLFERAKTIYQTLKTSGKGKRNFDFLSAYDAILNSNNHNDADADGYDEIYRSLFINVQVNELIAGQPMKVWRQEAEGSEEEPFRPAQAERRAHRHWRGSEHRLQERHPHYHLERRREQPQR